MSASKRKNKNFYANAAKKARNAGQGRALAENMTGFLLTCNNREKEAVREAYNLFNEYADDIFGPETGETEGKKTTEDDDEEEDIDAAFDKEKAVLKEKKKEGRRFQVVESGANNCIFIKTTVQDPVLLVDKLVEDIYAKKEGKARYILRLIPILGTCKAYEKNMTELAMSCLKEPFKEGTAPTYSILFKTRNNNQVKRDDTIQTIAKVVKELNAETKVEFKNPDICVIVEIIRNVCCIGVCRNFYKYKKYNLAEMAKPEEETKTSEAVSVEAITNGANGQEVEDADNNVGDNSKVVGDVVVDSKEIGKDITETNGKVPETENSEEKG